jgi:hypothetical protein
VTNSRPRSRIAAVAAILLAAGLCAVTATPASATVPTGWESKAMDLPAAQQLSKGAGITVAVLDTGVVTGIPDLKGKVTTGPVFLHDGLKPGDPTWGGHGTAMASDLLKVAPKTHVLSVRVISDNEPKPVQPGTSDSLPQRAPSPIAEGVEYAVKHGADVITMSLGNTPGWSSFDQSEFQAFAYAANHHVTVLASAGNDGSLGAGDTVSYPAAYPSVISVAATQQDGQRAEFSTSHTYNSIAAPGVGIISDWAADGRQLVDGTSPACALAAGVVALMLARNHDLTPGQVRAILTTTAHHPAGGHTEALGWGPVDAGAAVRAAGSPPAAQPATLPYTGRQHLAAPEGTAPVKHAPRDPGTWYGGLAAAGAGLLLVIGCVLLARGRRPSDD